MLTKNWCGGISIYHLLHWTQLGATGEGGGLQYWNHKKVRVLITLLLLDKPQASWDFVPWTKKTKQSSLEMCRFVYGWQNDACKEKNITPAVKLVEFPPCCDAALPLLLEAQNVRKEVNQMIAQAFYNECAISWREIKIEMKMLGFQLMMLHRSIGGKKWKDKIWICPQIPFSYRKYMNNLKSAIKITKQWKVGGGNKVTKTQ